MSFFITLVESSDANRRAIETLPRVHSMMHKGLTLAEYRAFLRDLYHIVWHFCPIMAAAASRCNEGLRNIRYELYERIEEEKGHEGHAGYDGQRQEQTRGDRDGFGLAQDLPADVFVGKLALLRAHEMAIEREDPLVGRVAIHFPRSCYHIRPV